MTSVESIKKLGLNKSEENLDFLISLFDDLSLNIDIRREIVSSIGRQKNNSKIYKFIKEHAFNCGYMDLVYQMFRTCLYKKEDIQFDELRKDLKEGYFEALKLQPLNFL